MWRFYSGAVLVVAGVAGLIEAHRYRPFPAGYFTPGVPGAPSRLSQTSYDILRVGAFTLVILGALIVAILGLSRYLRRVHSSP
jgi:hypothetical protein